MWYQQNGQTGEYRRDYWDRVCEDSGVTREVMPEGEFWRPIHDALSRMHAHRPTAPGPMRGLLDRVRFIPTGLRRVLSR